MLTGLVYMKPGYINAYILKADYNETYFIYIASIIITVFIVAVCIYIRFTSPTKITVGPMCL